MPVEVFGASASGAVRSADLFRYFVVVKHGSLVSRVGTWAFAVAFVSFIMSRVHLMTAHDEVTVIREQTSTASDYELQIPLFGITCNDGAGGHFNETYMSVVFELRDIYAANEKTSTRVELGSVPCYMPHQKATGWCPAVNSTIMGTFGDPDYRFLEISFNKCVNKTASGEPCASPEEIRKVFTRGGVSIDVWSFRSKGWSSWETLYLSIHPDIIQMVEIFLSPVNVKVVAQYPWEVDKTESHIMRESYYTRFSESVDGTQLLKAILRISSSSMKDTVRRVSLIEALTQIAAVWTLSVSGIGSLFVLYNFIHWRKWYDGRYPWQVQYHYLPEPPSGAPKVVQPERGLAKENKSWSWMKKKGTFRRSRSPPPRYREMEDVILETEAVIAPISETSSLHSLPQIPKPRRPGIRRSSLPPGPRTISPNLLNLNNFPTRARARSVTPPRPRANSALRSI
eukprot:TRINITY_DN9185_c0_g1_i1.p1 TRINITY_DN9185_c0_g1~~TRINITY_DN9185_c0_g1_i1.p1  ORF type:complete len:455 (+),score=37.66 TRINITY_DN9185_c0_g1_i1:65-1429(+)